MKKQMTYLARIALVGSAGLCVGILALPDDKGHVPPQAMAEEAPLVVAAAETPPPVEEPVADPVPVVEPALEPEVVEPTPEPEPEVIEVEASPKVQAQSLPPAEKEKAEVAPAAPRWDEDQAVAAVEAYFKASETLRATFTQFAPDGSRSTGVLSLKRPGRVRFEYDAPSPLLIIADGVWISLADTQMDTVDRYPVAATPLGVILQDDKNLRKEAIVTGFYQDQDRFELIVRARDNPGLGRLSLKLTKNPVTLDGWAVEDAQGLVTEIRLSDMKTGVELNPALFHISDVKKIRDR